MTQRTAFILAAALTAFVLVVVGAVMARVGLAGEGVAAAGAEPTALTVSPQAQPPATPPPLAQPQGDAPTYPISPELAATIAVNTLPGASVLRTPELVDFQGTVAYEVQLDAGNVYVDATTGRILNPGTRFGLFGRRSHEEHEWFEDEHEGEHEDDDL